MAIILRTESSISGLVEDLAALRAADAQEVLDRIAGDAARQTATDAALAAEIAARIAGDNAQSLALQNHINGAFADAKALLDVVNGDANTTGSFRKAIADLIDGAPVALDTLKEIADYIAVNPNANIAAAITAQINAAIASVTGAASSVMNDLGKVETALNAETAARIAADNALNTSLRAYIDSSVQSTYTTFVIETGVLTGGKITASHAPQNGVVWDCTIRDANGLIIADVTPTVTGTEVNIGSISYDGLTLSITYGYGAISAALLELLPAAIAKEIGLLLPPATPIGGITGSFATTAYDPAVFTVSNNGLTVTHNSLPDQWATLSVAQGVSSGKHYFEVHVDSEYSWAAIVIGFTTIPTFNNNYKTLGDAGFSLDSSIGIYTDSIDGAPGSHTGIDIGPASTATITANPNLLFTVGNTVGLALDMDNGTLAMIVNGVNSGVIISNITGTLYPAMSSNSGTEAVTFNFGATPFVYAPPAGFTAGYIGSIGAISPQQQFYRGDKTWSVLSKEVVGVGSWQIVSSSLTALPRQSYLAVTSAAPFSITLPPSPLDNDFVCIADGGNAFDVNNLTIIGNGNTIAGLPTDHVLSTKSASVTLLFKPTLGWRFI